MLCYQSEEYVSFAHYRFDHVFVVARQKRCISEKNILYVIKKERAAVKSAKSNCRKKGFSLL